MVMTLINRLDSAFVCPGNSDEKFVDDCKKRGGEIKTNRGNGETVAYIDRAPIIDANGKYCDCTIRRVDCDILCDPVGLYPIRCKHCDAFRSTLYGHLSRDENTVRTALCQQVTQTMEICLQMKRTIHMHMQSFICSGYVKIS